MRRVRAVVHRATGTDKQYAHAAFDALDALDWQLAFDLDPSLGETFVTDGENWDEVRRDLEASLTDDQLAAENTCHVAVIDEPFDVLGAGIAWRIVGGGNCGLCGVNGAIRGYVNFIPWCSGDGGDAFRATTIQEFAHTMDTPHEAGAVYEWESGDPASPMITWYTEENCGFNTPVTSACDGESNQTQEAYVTDATDCAVAAIEEHHRYWFG